jgi:hypothetical protein
VVGSARGRVDTARFGKAALRRPTIGRRRRTVGAVVGVAIVIFAGSGRGTAPRIKAICRFAIAACVRGAGTFVIWR